MASDGSREKNNRIQPILYDVGVIMNPFQQSLLIISRMKVMGRMFEQKGWDYVNVSTLQLMLITGL